MVSYGQKGNYNAFVKWDDAKPGGRYFECNYVDDGKSWILPLTCHDGDSGTYHCDDIFPIEPHGYNSERDCIAYWDDRPYAFKGRINAYRDGKYFVAFEDGDKKWISTDKVYKYQSLRFR